MHDRTGTLYDSARQVRRDSGERRQEDKDGPLVPVLECVEALARGQLRAHFGYENDTEGELHVPIGYHNEFRPGPKDRDQPIDFKPGTHQRVVSVTFDHSESATWLLEGGKAVADSDSPRCKDRGATDCEDPKGCAPRAGSGGKREDGGAPSPPAKPSCTSCCSGSAGSCGSRPDDVPPPAKDAGAACDDAGAAPSDAGIDAAVGDKRCPDGPEFAGNCVGALRCGPYQGPVHANCSRTCCGQPVSFTVPLPTIAECIQSRWAFSIDPGASTDACDQPYACPCTPPP